MRNVVVKFTIKNIGPIKDADIELGDFTIFLGYPSTGKSYALRAIYSSLALLDDATIDKLNEQKQSLLKESYAGIDYVILYIRNLISLGFDVCNKEDLTKVIEKINSVTNSNVQIDEVSSPSERNCIIKLKEEINLREKTLKIIENVREKITHLVLEKIEKSIGYSEDNKSSIKIKGNELRDLIKREINPTLSILKNEDILEPTEFFFSGGSVREEGKVSIIEDLLRIVVNISIRKIKPLENRITQNEVDNITMDFLNVLPKYYQSSISRVMDLNILSKGQIQTLISEEYNSVLFIPYGRSELLLLYNKMRHPSEKSIINDKYRLDDFEIDWTHSSFLFSLEKSLDKIADKKSVWGFHF
ncbi:hypothetical protein [Sulfolobus sp. E11-6]|uniref:hypothetical protein n=1 Tax=Sulfolobus sp. E11-6 TaxID=2663020 RepID=UPI001295305F|nr:hypothetical protein [Sulfolobus sp. E11-6]QGA68556.1 hypothetical protein GFS33_07295 [Sulfolobus sp. E11-6]